MGCSLPRRSLDGTDSDLPSPCRTDAWFYAGAALANSFNGLLSAVVLDSLDGNMGIAGWRWLYIVRRSLPSFATSRNLALTPHRRRLPSRRLRAL